MPVFRPLLATALLLIAVGGASAEPLAHEQRLALWPERPQGTPTDLEPTIVERSDSLFRADRALMGIADPSLTVFLPERPNGTSLIVAPGGSYRRVVLDKEGIEIAEALAPRGVTVFLLAYRLPGEGHADAADAPLADGQRAVRLIRAHAAEWGLDPDRIGFLGFSAAGHLGASLATGFARDTYPVIDTVDALSARPDFTALVYPVITMMGEVAHAGSREALLGAAPDEATLEAQSPERHVSADTPEVFMVLANDDSSVVPENAILFYSALRKASVPAELHVFREGGHGFGIRGATDLPVSRWPDLLEAWMRRIGMMPIDEAAGTQGLASQDER